MQIDTIIINHCCWWTLNVKEYIKDKTFLNLNVTFLQKSTFKINE